VTEPVRVAVCADFAEEGWPSMDRVAVRLLDALARAHAGEVAASDVRPPFARRATRLAATATAATIDRGLNRLFDYPRHAARMGNDFDVFHLVDHSYSQLVHRLPAERTVITCHDLDTFQSVLAPETERRSPAFRAMTRHILRGFAKAGCVACDTAAIRDEVLARGLVAEEHLAVAPLGVGDEFSPAADPQADRAAANLLGPRGPLDLLHVGSTIPRKRIDRLLRICAALMQHAPGVRLIRVGGVFTSEQSRLAGSLGLQDRILALPAIDDRTLAAVYRRVDATLLTSDREGFGLPVVESLRCGTPVIATDLAVLREVGGADARYCPAGDVEAWAREIVTVRNLTAEQARQRSGAAVQWAGRFTWERFAAQMTSIYSALACRRTTPQRVHSLV
jgi:glycosyltransferase involved in cell wall biosynthesis